MHLNHFDKFTPLIMGNHFYRQHPKDGEGNVFTSVCLFTEEREEDTPGQVPGPVCGRYVSCGHAGGLSCFKYLIIVFSHKYRIADLFTHNEADEIKDRKDKFKRYFFCKINMVYERWQGLVMT